MDDDVGALLDGPAEVRGGERIVDDERHTGLIGDVGDALDVRDGASRD